MTSLYIVYIFIYMPNRMIYISEAIVPDFDQEPNKSGLVNRLLAKHYGAPFHPKTVNPHDLKPGSKITVKPPVNIEERIEQLKTAGTCKNGHLLQPGRDKCSGKGCRYSL